MVLYLILTGLAQAMAMNKCRRQMLEQAYENMHRQVQRVGTMPVHSLWRTFSTFAQDMGLPPPHAELKLHDPMVGYMPWNCYWHVRGQPVPPPRPMLAITPSYRPGPRPHAERYMRRCSRIG